MKNKAKILTCAAAGLMLAAAYVPAAYAEEVGKMTVHTTLSSASAVTVDGKQYVKPGADGEFKVSIEDAAWTKQAGDTTKYKVETSVSALEFAVDLSNVSFVDNSQEFVKVEYAVASGEKTFTKGGEYNFPNAKRLKFGYANFADAGDSNLALGNVDGFVTVAVKIDPSAADNTVVSAAVSGLKGGYDALKSSKVATVTGVATGELTVDAAKPTITGDTSKNYTYSPVEFTVADSASGIKSVTIAGEAVTVGEGGKISLTKGGELVVTDNVGNETKATITMDAAKYLDAVEKINAIPATVTIADEDTVRAAEAAYDLLDAEAKGKVDATALKTKLDAAVSTINSLTAEKTSRRDAVVAAINALPATTDTASDIYAKKADIVAARTLADKFFEDYNIADAKKADSLGSGAYEKLTALETKVAATKTAVDAAVTAINALPADSADFLYTDKEKLAAAKTAIDAAVTAGAATADISNYAIYTANNTANTTLDTAITAAKTEMHALDAITAAAVKYGDNTKLDAAATTKTNMVAKAVPETAYDAAKLTAAQAIYKTEITDKITAANTAIAAIPTKDALKYGDDTLITAAETATTALVAKEVPTTAFTDYANIAARKNDYKTEITEQIADINVKLDALHTTAATVMAADNTDALEAEIAALTTARNVPATTAAYSNYAKLALAKAAYKTGITDVVTAFESAADALPETFNYDAAKAAIATLNAGNDTTGPESYMAYLADKGYTSEKLTDVNTKVASYNTEITALETKMGEAQATVDSWLGGSTPNKAAILALQSKVNAITAKGTTLNTVMGGNAARVTCYNNMIALIAEEAAAYASLSTDIKALLGNDAKVLYTMEDQVKEFVTRAATLKGIYTTDFATYDDAANTLVNNALTKIATMKTDATALNTAMAGLTKADDATYADIAKVKGVTDKIAALNEVAYPTTELANYAKYTAAKAATDAIQAKVDAAKAKFAALPASKDATTWGDKAAVEAARAAYNALSTYALGAGDYTANEIVLTKLTNAEAGIAAIQDLVDDAQAKINALQAGEVKYPDLTGKIKDAEDAVAAVTAKNAAAALTDTDKIAACKTEYATEITDKIAAVKARLAALASVTADNVTQANKTEADAIRTEMKRLADDRGVTPADATVYGADFANLAKVDTAYTTGITGAVTALKSDMDTTIGDPIKYADKAKVEALQARKDALIARGVDPDELVTAKFTKGVADVAAMVTELNAQKAANEALMSSWNIDDNTKRADAKTATEALVGKYEVGGADQNKALAEDVLTAAIAKKTAADEKIAATKVSAKKLAEKVNKENVDEMAALIKELTEVYMMTPAQLNSYLTVKVPVLDPETGAPVIDPETGAPEEKDVNYYDIYKKAHDRIYPKPDPAPEPPKATPTPTPTYQPATVAPAAVLTIPATGDASNPMLWVCLAALAAAALAVFCLLKKHNADK